MNKMNLLLLIVMLTVLGGCAKSPALLRESSASLRSDVFEVLTNEGGKVPEGFADLRVTASVKTHKPGLFSAKDLHGTPGYQLQLDVDGQTVLLRGGWAEENLNPLDLEDPEAGEGIRYQFSKTLRLKPGKHSIIVALPADKIAVEKEITLVEKELNSLALEPVYGRVSEKKRPSSNRVTGFEAGITGIRLIFNGRSI
jgi:hypothetical protein